jgi:hypothetical protein
MAMLVMGFVSSIAHKSFLVYREQRFRLCVHILDCWWGSEPGVELMASGGYT